MPRVMLFASGLLKPNFALVAEKIKIDSAAFISSKAEKLPAKPAASTKIPTRSGEELENSAAKTAAPKGSVPKGSFASEIKKISAE